MTSIKMLSITQNERFCFSVAGLSKYCLTRDSTYVIFHITFVVSGGNHINVLKILA